jgi:acyl carrier protein
MATVREHLVQMITEVCRPHPVDLSDHGRPLLDIGLDSLDYTSVLMAVEDYYKVEISDLDLEQLGSIDGLVTFIEAQAGA